MREVMNIKTLLARAALDLAHCGSSSPHLDADVFLMHLLKIDRVRLLSHPEQEVSEEDVGVFNRFLQRRMKGEPVSYIVGEKEFWSLLFAVSSDVLVPRPETECLIEEVLRFYPPPGEGLRLCDVGTGSGIIAVVLAKELPLARIVASDISAKALAVAAGNAMRHGVADRIDFVEADILPVDYSLFDVLCSNPPYITDDQYELLPEGIRRFEPRGALIAGRDGLDYYRKVVTVAASCLKAGGRIFLEAGEGQAQAVAALLVREDCCTDIYCRSDYGGVERVVSARRR